MALVTNYWLLDIALLLLCIFSGAYGYFWYIFRHWKRRGLAVAVPPKFPMGNYSGINTVKIMDEITSDLYKAAKDLPLFGVFFLNKPIIILKDMELIKNVLVKDFSSFHDRGFDFDLTNEPLAGHLFLMNGQEWRNLRIKLIPAFTSGKMKVMFPTVVDVGKQLNQVLEDCTKNEDTEVKDILARFTTDVISSVAFGIDSYSLKNPKSIFRQMGLELTNPTLYTKIVSFLAFAIPAITKILPFSLIPRHITTFFISVVRDAMDYRTKNNAKRNDFLQLLLELKTLGYITDADNREKNENEGEAQKFTLEQAAAQAFLFYFAGFETSAATLQFTLYELALSEEIQDRLRQEIDRSMEENDGELTYDGLLQLDYLDRVVEETLRKYPVAGTLMRECSKEYQVPGSDFVFQKGDHIWIPTYSMHYDPNYYPQPDKFDPDRFLPEQKETRPNYTYMPFGEGPRNCIGNRFALMQIKVCIAMILSKFKVSPSSKTPIPMVYDASKGVLAPKGDMHLKISHRDVKPAIE